MTRKTIMLLLSIAVMNISVAFGAEKQDSVEGTLTVNEVTYQLKYVYINELFGDELIVCMLDKPVSKEKCPDYVPEIAATGEIHGLSIGISKSEKGPFKDSYSNYIFYEFNGIGGEYNANIGTLTIKTLSDDLLDAKLILEEPGHYQYDVSFTVNINI